MNKLKKLVAYCKIQVLNGGNCPLFCEIERCYKEQFNIDDHLPPENYQMNRTLGGKIADHFEQLEHNPQDKIAQAAYRQMVREVLAQFHFLQNSDMKIAIEPYTGSGEPYADSFDMLMDLHQRHMYFLPTLSGFGSSDQISLQNHPMLADAGIRIGDYDLVVNDVFRIVHDIFGHAAHGYSFGPQGEEQAWFVHQRMFSPLARAAITTETRGQNCWVNYGPHMRDSQGKLLSQQQQSWLPPAKRPFAEQKVGLLPEVISGVRVIENDNGIQAMLVPGWHPYQSVTGTQHA